jgi:hypothetical protein
MSKKDAAATKTKIRNLLLTLPLGESERIRKLLFEQVDKLSGENTSGKPSSRKPAKKKGWHFCLNLNMLLL